jgi:hypothetical protein
MARQLLAVDGLFKALADTARLRILGLLFTGEGWVPCCAPQPQPVVLTLRR